MAKVMPSTIYRANREHLAAMKPEGRFKSPIKPARAPIGKLCIYDHSRFPHIAKILCEEYGFIQRQLAQVFGVSLKTIELWMHKYPEFKIAVQEGKDHFDTVNVESALLKIALGYEYEEKSVRQVSVRGVDSEGNKINVPGKETVVTTKQVAPNAKAIALWLTNRQPDRWRLTSTVNATINSKTEHTERTLNVSADLTKMDSSQLRALRDLITTQKTETLSIEHKEDTSIFDVLQRAKDLQEAEEAEYV